MILYHDFKKALLKFPKKYHDYILMGHISEECFDDEERANLEEMYPELTCEINDFAGTEYEHIKFMSSYDIFGKVGEPFGVACITINETFYILPKHFMNVDEIHGFISDHIKWHPEIKI